MSASAHRPTACPTTISQSCAFTFTLRSSGAHASRPDSITSGIVSPSVDPLTSLTGTGILPEPLTQREQEVLALLLRAKTNREIAGDLVISMRTVESHLSTIYGKLGVRGRSEAMLWAVNADIRSEPGGRMRETYRSGREGRARGQGLPLSFR
jgi:DNA-binding NarL/FixJ family response regulator